MKQVLSSPSVSFERNFGHYQVKVATNNEEKQKAFKLRYDVFYREFAGIKSDESIDQLDVEEHDLICDHLLVKDLRSGEVIACYRLLFEDFKPSHQSFYSESEFHIDEFLDSGLKKLELGRACVHQNYRRGTVIILLWRGLIEYSRICGAQYFFGCSSISHEQFSYIPEVLSDIRNQKKFITEWAVDVKESYKFDLKNLDLSSSSSFKSHTSLMQIYLNAGAKVGETLAYDRTLNCIDLFTVLNLTELPDVFRKGLSD